MDVLNLDRLLTQIGSAINNLDLLDLVINRMLNFGEYQRMFDWLDMFKEISVDEKKRDILLLMKKAGQAETALSKAMKNFQEEEADQSFWINVFAELDSATARPLFDQLGPKIPAYIKADEKSWIVKGMAEGLTRAGLDWRDV